MEKNIDIDYPVGVFEDLKMFDLEELGNIEDFGITITADMERKMVSRVNHRCERAVSFVENGEYDVAEELLKSAQWLVSIMANKKKKDEHQK